MFSSLKPAFKIARLVHLWTKYILYVESVAVRLPVLIVYPCCPYLGVLICNSSRLSPYTSSHLVFKCSRLCWFPKWFGRGYVVDGGMTEVLGECFHASPLHLLNLLSKGLVAHARFQDRSPGAPVDQIHVVRRIRHRSFAHINRMPLLSLPRCSPL